MQRSTWQNLNTVLSNWCNNDTNQVFWEFKLSYVHWCPKSTTHILNCNWDVLVIIFSYSWNTKHILSTMFSNDRSLPRWRMTLLFRHNYWMHNRCSKADNYLTFLRNSIYRQIYNSRVLCFRHVDCFENVQWFENGLIIFY